ncbi:MAG: hypothetical protein AAFY17_17130, partial [Cyanobacteria bacterium J06642_11]
KPGSYLRFWQTLMQQKLSERAMTLLLILLAGILILHCANQAWELAQSFYRTWHCSQLRRRSKASYGIVLLPDVMVARLIDNLGRHNCLWLPQEALVNIAWQRMREEGAKHSRWVDRTRIGYIAANGKHRWLTLKGNVVDLGAAAREEDRILYETLVDWWQPHTPPSESHSG